MKKIVTTLLLANLIGCSEQPQNYSCKFIDQPKTAMSLSIKGNTATLDQFKPMSLCFKNGNVNTYGFDSADCKSYTSKTEENFSVITFDPITGKLLFRINFENGKGTSESFNCTKVN